MAGYIKIYRDVLDTVLFQKPILLQMWLWLNKNARYVKAEQEGIEILPGQVLVSAGELAKSVNLTERRVRYILDCLEEMELITRENIRNRYTLITLVNPDELKNVKQTTLPDVNEAKAQTTPSQPAKEAKATYGVCENVYLTAEEKKLLQKRSSVSDSYIDRLSAYKRRTNKEYSDDFAVLCEWITKDEITASAKPATAASQQDSGKPSNAPAATAMREREKPSRQSLAKFSGAEYDFANGPASYDLELAERIARTSVPKFRKRPKTENEKIGLP